MPYTLHPFSPKSNILNNYSIVSQNVEIDYNTIYSAYSDFTGFTCTHL